MAEHISNQIYTDVIRALGKNDLLRALYQLRTLIKNSANWELREKWDEINQAYHSLLHYMSQGVMDEQRNTFYTQFLAKTYYLAVATYREIQIKNNDNPYYSFLRRTRQEGIELASLKKSIEKTLDELFFLNVTASPEMTEKLRVNYESQMNDLFNLVCTSSLWSAEETEEMTSLFKNISLPEDDHLLLLSAITLSLTNVIDSRKIQILIDDYHSDSKKAKIRALTGICFTVIIHQKMLHHFPSLVSAISELNKNIDFITHLTALQIRLFTLSRTKEAQHKINDEIIPNLMKIKPSGQNSIFDISQMEEILDEDKAISSTIDKDLAKKFQSGIDNLMKWHDQGIDIYYPTFRNLKYFTFFINPANWFRPFSFEHSELKEFNSSMSSLRAIIIEADLNDSDKYSMAEMLLSLPEMNKEMVKKQMEAILGQEVVTIENTSNDSLLDENTLMRYYLQNCYRFFKLYHNRSEFNNPFDNKTIFIEIPVFHDIYIKNPYNILELSYLAFKQEHWSVVTSLYLQLPSDLSLNFDDELMFGSSFLKQNHLEEAISCFEKAYLLQPLSVEVLRNLAYSYRMINQFEKACESYGKIIALAPEDCNALFHYGECLFLQNKTKQALKQFYKVEYLCPQTLSAQRAIAWCLLTSGDAKNAEKYYLKILAGTQKADDYLNGGHSAWAVGDIILAVKRYRKYIELSERKAELFSFQKSDAELLGQYNIKPSDIHFMSDLLNEQETLL